MLIARQSLGFSLAASYLLLTGCSIFPTKTAEVVGDAPAPPPAAYPDSSPNLMADAPAGSTPSSAYPSAPSSTQPSAIHSATAGSVASTPAAAPFSLRTGEQLVPYQVQLGDNLSNIAAKFNTSVARIQAANGMVNTKIIAGKTIQVPTSAAPSGMTGQAPTVAPMVNSGYPSMSPSNLAPSVPTPSYPPAPAVPATSAVPGSSAALAPYPSTMGGPTSSPMPSAPAPSAPAASPYPSSASGAISAPPVPQGSGVSGAPSSTSYPRTAPVPSFEASRVQFSN